MRNGKVVAALMALFMAHVCPCALAEVSSEDSKFMYSSYSKKVSMDFKDAALPEVLKIFSQQSGMNFIAESDVSNKRVTLFFENIPVEEALEKILETNGLTYETKPGSDIFVVKDRPNADEIFVTKIFALKHATVSSSKMNKTIEFEKKDDKSSSGSASDKSSGADSKSSGGSGIVSTIKAVLSPKGKLTEDPRTNSIIVTDTEKQFLVIEDAIKRLDVEIPQILIQVEMLDVSKGTADLMGIKYSDTMFKLTGAKRQVMYPWDLRMLKNKGYTFEDPEYTAGLLDTSTMTAVVQFLETQSDTRNLARPRLLTLNNETAEIKIATNEAIGLQNQTNATSGGTSTQSVEAERVETGVFLLVTPQANLTTGEITLAVAPRVIQARTGATFAGQTFKDPEERGSQQLMRVKDGETVVIGGLLRRDTANIVTKVPILGDLPLIGRAFRHADKSNSERELLIFITPSIVSESNKEKLLSDSVEGGFSGEQEIPKDRLNQINRELSSVEQQRF